jgi:ABC-type glycerol-3-phosphate transport system substrate-binding protein
MLSLWKKSFSLILLSVVFSVSVAQSDRITLTVTVPDWMASGMTDAVFQPFEEEHPGVEVIYVPLGEIQLIASPSFSDLETHLQDVEEYAVKADVLYVYNINHLSIESTRAGYWLDLEPLLSSDPNFDGSAYYPSLLKSFQWEGGAWALPAKTNVQLLYYDRDAFDRRGVSYPHNNWTLEDFAAAVRALAEENPDGGVKPAFASWDDTLFIRSLMRESLYEEDGLEHLPNFTSPELQTVLQTWGELYQEGVVSSFSSNLSSKDVPMFVERSSLLYNHQERNLEAVLLPNNTALLEVTGFAVSGGTQHPDLAYALAAYLTQTPEVTAYISGDVAAYRTSNDVQVEGVWSWERSLEQQALIDEALANGIPAGELAYRDYLTRIVGQVTRGQSDDLNPQLEAAAA